MRIDEREAMPAVQVLDSHRLQQGGFACAGFSDDVDVRKTIISQNPERMALISEISLTKIRDFVLIVGHAAMIRVQPIGCTTRLHAGSA